jgi:hypothetical protein
MADQVVYVGNPDFVAAANGETPMPEGYVGLHTESKPPTTRPMWGKTLDEGRVRGPRD